jgi:general secretion pathway protein A
VLEQLRLLSNLETTREKLLQIILVGQPELAEMLDSHDLRQIGQRISLRYQITPLNFKDTRDYIQYRLNIASHKSTPIFKKGAYRHIYQYSRGIPRLINIACDRALLTAFSLNRPTVTGQLARHAVKEMTGRGRPSSIYLMDGRKALGAFLILCALTFGWLYHKELSEKVATLFRKPAAETAAPAPSGTAPPPSSSSPAPAAPPLKPAADTKAADPSQSHQG